MQLQIPWAVTYPERSPGWYAQAHLHWQLPFRWRVQLCYKRNFITQSLHTDLAQHYSRCCKDFTCINYKALTHAIDTTHCWNVRSGSSYITAVESSCQLVVVNHVLQQITYIHVRSHLWWCNRSHKLTSSLDSYSLDSVNKNIMRHGSVFFKSSTVHAHNERKVEIMFYQLLDPLSSLVDVVRCPWFQSIRDEKDMTKVLFRPEHTQIKINWSQNTTYVSRDRYAGIFKFSKLGMHLHLSTHVKNPWEKYYLCIQRQRSITTCWSKIVCLLTPPKNPSWAGWLNPKFVAVLVR